MYTCGEPVSDAFIDWIKKNASWNLIECEEQLRCCCVKQPLLAHDIGLAASGQPRCELKPQQASGRAEVYERPWVTLATTRRGAGGAVEGL